MFTLRMHLRLSVRVGAVVLWWRRWQLLHVFLFAPVAADRRGSWRRWSPMTARCSLCYCCTLQCPELSSHLQWSLSRGQRCWSDAVFHQGPPPQSSEPGRMLGFLWWVKPSAGRERASEAVTPLYQLYPCPQHHFGPRAGLPSVVVFSWGLTPRCPFVPWPVWTKEIEKKH